MMGTVGGNLTLRCQPEAAPQPTITWTHNGAPVGSSGHAQVGGTQDVPALTWM